MVFPEDFVSNYLWVSVLNKFPGTTTLNTSTWISPITRLNPGSSIITNSTLRLPLPLLAIKIVVVFVLDLLSDLGEVHAQFGFSFLLLLVVVSLLLLSVGVVVAAGEVLRDHLHVHWDFDCPKHVDVARMLALLLELAFIVLGDKHGHVDYLVAGRSLIRVDLE